MFQSYFYVLGYIKNADAHRCDVDVSEFFHHYRDVFADAFLLLHWGHSFWHNKIRRSDRKTREFSDCFQRPFCSFPHRNR